MIKHCGAYTYFVKFSHLKGSTTIKKKLPLTRLPLAQISSCVVSSGGMQFIIYLIVDMGDLAFHIHPLSVY